MVERQSSEETAATLNSAAIHLLRALRETDRLSGLSDARLSALSVLVFGGPCTLGGLAEAEGVTPATMSRIVDGLVVDGHAVRQAHPESARKILVRATARGTRLMHKARQRRIDAIADALDRLPTAERARVVEGAAAVSRLAGELAARADVQPSRPTA